MAGMEELMSRLQSLEDGYYGDKELARQDAFMNQYGSRFSNDRGLGLAILNELGARGIDTSAADEAVTNILDQLRTECNELLSLLTNVQDAAVEQADKIDKIAEVVASTVADNPEASEEPPIPGGEEIMPEENAELNELATEGEPPVAAEDIVPTEGEMPVEEPAPEEVAPEGEMPVEEPAPEEAPADTTLSDKRMKKIKVARKSVGGFKPTAGMLAACGGN